MKTQKKQYAKEYNSYHLKRQIWVSQMKRYSVSLADIIQNEHDDFRIWMSSHNKSDLLNNITKSDIENIHNKIQYVNDKNHIIYWIAKFKDHMMNIIQQQKPITPVRTKIFNSKIYLMTHLTDLRSKFISNNEQIKYYVFDIHYNFSDINCTPIQYKKTSTSFTYESRRLMADNGPYCNTIRF